MKLKCVGRFARLGRLLSLPAVAVAPAAAAEPVGDPPADDVRTGDGRRDPADPAAGLRTEARRRTGGRIRLEGTFSIAYDGGYAPQTVGQFSTPGDGRDPPQGRDPGSSRTLAQKAAFKIKFNPFENAAHEKGKKYLGLKKTTLNNMVQDGSSIPHEPASPTKRSARPGWRLLAPATPTSNSTAKTSACI